MLAQKSICSCLPWKWLAAFPEEKGGTGTEQCSSEWGYMWGVTESSSSRGAVFWIEQHFCVCVLWSPILL